MTLIIKSNNLDHLCVNLQYHIHFILSEDFETATGSCFAKDLASIGVSDSKVVTCRLYAYPGHQKNPPSIQSASS